MEYLLGYEIVKFLHKCDFVKDVEDSDEPCSFTTNDLYASICILIETTPPGCQHYSMHLFSEYLMAMPLFDVLHHQAVEALKADKELSTLLFTQTIDSKLLDQSKSTELETEEEKVKPELELRKFYTRTLSSSSELTQFLKRIKDLFVMKETSYLSRFVFNITYVSTRNICILMLWPLAHCKACRPLVNVSKNGLDWRDVTDLLNYYNIMVLTQNYYICCIPVRDIYFAILHVWLCDSAVFLHETVHKLMNHLIYYCWNRWDQSNVNRELYPFDTYDHKALLANEENRLYQDL
ncbi:hypothetical protein RFI_25633, partial [Reticulomyxa filosa]